MFDKNFYPLGEIDVYTLYSSDTYFIAAMFVLV